MTDQATPRPWALIPPDSDDMETIEECKGIYRDGYICPIVNNKDAQLIVKCVNMHDELVEALELAISTIKDMPVQSSGIIPTIEKIKFIKQALSKAQEEN